MSKSLLVFVFLVLISVSGLKVLPGNNDNNKTLNLGYPDLEISSNVQNNLNGNVNIEFKDLGIMKASWYGPRFHGRLTANGEIYDQMGLTIAHKSLPFNTLLRLTNPSNKKSLIVRVNDRGPYIPGRQIDLSKKVAMELGIYKKGVAKVKVEKVKVKGVISPIID
ncbi:septal ring lytic transglycosylase RlpA family protein [bacterium BMS3Abin03]|nr:septal ring lytic transglycosylase RlpA family protein [bacterium BMS3Abin03]MCG6960466.1 septal ring lytic transglycosylase RlpA family protein [bacterium BMS3Abin03]